MELEQYPELFLGTDSASRRAQGAHALLLRFQLAFLVLASLLSSFSSWPFGQIESLRTAIAAVLAVNLILLGILRLKQYDRIWFDCRAVAESVKSSTWRYVMRVTPFTEELSPEAADALFIEELRQMRLARPQVGVHLTAHSQNSQITDEMRRIRGLPLADRRRTYLEDRLHEQLRWYTRMTRSNRTWSEFWFWASSVTQAAALIFAILGIILLPLVANLVSLLMTLTAAFIAWTQARRYEELAQAYGLASQELIELRTLSAYFTEPEDFSKFVEQIEEAISREHTMWRARRNIPLGYDQIVQRTE